MAAMKHGHSFAIAILALALAACGGSGGNDRNTGDEPVGLTNEPRVEAILEDPSLDPGFLYQDPLNLQTGDTVRFQLVNYTNGGSTRNVLAADRFSTDDTRNDSGQLDPTIGVFRAANASVGNRQYTVGARFQGITYTANYQIKPRQIRLRGKVLAQGTGNPVYNATIDFYAPRNPSDTSTSQVIIATVRSSYDGTFRVSIPAFNDDVDTAQEANAAAQIRFTVRATNLPDGYFRSFRFNGLQYDAGSNVCRPTLLSRDTVTDPDTGEQVFLPFKSGDRYLVTQGDDAEAAGVIQLAPESLGEKPEPNGCDGLSNN